MANTHKPDDGAERFLKVVRNAALLLLVAAAMSDSIEEAVSGWRANVARWQKIGLERIDSRSAQMVEVAVGLLEASVPKSS